MEDFTLPVDVDAPWAAALEALPRGGVLSAGRFLALLAGAGEAAAEEAARSLEDRQICLDPADLPLPPMSEPAARRMALERRVLAERDLALLEASDPLRLCLEELWAAPSSGAEDPVRPLLARAAEAAAPCAGRGVPLADLLQEGALALWEALAAGALPEEALSSARRAQCRAVTLAFRTSGADQALLGQLRDLRRADAVLLRRLGRSPAVEELALELSLSPDQAARLLKLLRDVDAAAPAAPSPGAEPSEPSEEPLESTEAFRLRSRVDGLLSLLAPEDRRLLELSFGLDGASPRTPGEVARLLGLEPEQVLRREAELVARLRAAPEA